MRKRDGDIVEEERWGGIGRGKGREGMEEERDGEWYKRKGRDRNG
jgi:hypothetical protein